MTYTFSKVYIVILILWVPFYYFWGWIRFKFTADSSAGFVYFFESVVIVTIILLITSLISMYQNEYRNLWDYIICIFAIVIFFLAKGPGILTQLF